MADDKDAVVPEFRFKGFTDDWVQRKLGEVLKVNSGKDYKHLNIGNIPVYGTGGYMLSVDESISEIDAIGIGRKGTIDKPQFLSAPFWTVDTLFFMTPLQDNVLLFLYALSQNIEWAKMDESTGVPSLSKVNIENVDTYTPKTTEQTAIGNFFRTLDDTFTLHKRKLDGLKELKNGYLQQMFPQAGENVPRVRFDGFVEPWKINKAGEIFISVSDKNFPYLPVLSASQEKGMVLRGELGIDIKYDESALNTYKRIKKGQFAIHLRSFQGGFAYSNLEGITSPAYTILDYKNNKEHDSNYWKELFVSPLFIKRLETITYGIRDGKSISFSDFTTLDFFYPDKAEQTAIGNFFCYLDEQIATQQTKLDKLKQLKTAYLQKMFL